MSTPIYSPVKRPPRHVRKPTAELAEQMQRMIDMQYEQQQQLNEDSLPPLKIDNTEIPHPWAQDEDALGFFDPTVGQGSMVFASPSLSNESTAKSMWLPPKSPSPPPPQSSEPHESGDYTPTPHNTLGKGSVTSLFQGRSRGAMDLASLYINDNNNYGAVDSTTAAPPPPPPPPPPLPTHDFSYRNPDYHDYPYDTPIPPKAAIRHWNNEALLRSFCYGAIDGMLTGSGIVSTFLGLGLVGEHSLIVVVFSLAACFADSVGMALGHVWTTHIVATVQAHQRLQALQQFQQARADAKGQLVDLLLQRGMLKIDAMSLADTLEGYPELFVNAIAGEALMAGEPARDHVEQPSSLPLLRNNDNKNAVHSYGRLTDSEMDPEAELVKAATAESKQESIVMTISFTLFAVLPSAIFNIAWALDSTTKATTSASHGKQQVVPPPNNPVHPLSLVMTILVSVMWVLGVWKSRFVDSGMWVVFGIEAVVVLLACIMAAFVVGATLKHTLDLDLVLQQDGNL